MSQQSLFQKFYSAINAVRQKISQQAGIQYIKVSSIEEIKDVPKLDYHDLSELDLREYKELFDYAPTESMPRSGIRGWTTNVIWPSPDKMPDGFNPMEIMERATEQQVPNIAEYRQIYQQYNQPIIQSTKEI